MKEDDIIRTHYEEYVRLSRASKVRVVPCIAFFISALLASWSVSRQSYGAALDFVLIAWWMQRLYFDEFR